MHEEAKSLSRTSHARRRNVRYHEVSWTRMFLGPEEDAVVTPTRRPEWSRFGGSVFDSWELH